MKHPILSLLIILLSITLGGCEHKELCYNHDEHSGVYNPVMRFGFIQDWETPWETGPHWKENWPSEFNIAYDDLRPALPGGVRARVYRPDGNINLYNYPVEGGKLHLNKPVDHSLIFYNNDTEYIVFNELNSYASASATTRTRSRPSYRGNSVLSNGAKDKEYTVGPPDMLYGSYIDVLNPANLKKGDTLQIAMHPLVFTYLIRFEFSHGLEYVAYTKGALAGMARTVYLTSGTTGKEEATILYDCEMTDYGSEAKVKSFGVPNFPNPDYARAPNQFGVTLEVTLKNGLHKNFDFDITDQMVSQPHGGVITIKGIEVPDDAGGGGGGGFDVDVEDWGDQQDIELPLD